MTRFIRYVIFTNRVSALVLLAAARSSLFFSFFFYVPINANTHIILCYFIRVWKVTEFTAYITCIRNTNAGQRRSAVFDRYSRV